MAPKRHSSIGWLRRLVLGLAAMIFIQPSNLVAAGSSEQRVELLLTGLPERTSKDYADLLRQAGPDVRIQALDDPGKETWSLPRFRLKTYRAAWTNSASRELPLISIGTGCCDLPAGA